MADGGGSKGCSRLCDLVGHALRHHTVVLAPLGRSDEPSSSSSAEEAAGALPTLAREAERDLLISLTMVCREIKRWTAEGDCDHEGANLLGSNFHTDCLCRLEPPFGCQRCLADIISLLVVFVASNSQYVRHMAGKVLVAISNFLVQYVSEWEEFIHLLWISIQVAVSSCASLCTSAESVILNVLHCPDSKDEAPTTTQDSENDAHFVALLQSRLKNYDWLMPAALIQVLHIIQKSLKNDGDPAESYLHFAVFYLLKVPWDLLSGVHSAHSGGLCFTPSVVGEEVRTVEPNCVFLGALLQLLCSLVEQNNLEVGDSPLDEISIYFKFTRLVSELLVCCFYNHQRYNSCMHQYLRHKALVLMIRLSCSSHWQHSSIVSWLQLLQKYFKDILHQPISRCHASHDISLEGSPFLASMTGEGKLENICTTHLQRQTIFLFLKCCFTLIGFGNQDSHECTYGLITSFTPESQKYGESCCFNGISEISGWLRRHVPLENHADNINYLKSCSRFSSSFLQLYMHEDDLLFEMLLQLLDAPFPTMQGQHNKHDNHCEKMGKDIDFHFSNIFSPIRLFHLFLSLIHYDHLVLLDYLISKDTGIHFLQYLLRCLHLVCKSWSAFIEFSTCSMEIGQPHSKRRKLYMNGQDSGEMVGVTFPVTDDISDFGMLETGDGTLHKFRGKQESSARPTQTFQNAKECLISLKTSVEDLQRKNLFPYSPAALLRRFTRFQRLCDDREKERIDGP